MVTEPILPNEIMNIRVFHYSCAQIFEAWSNPELLAQWWGPKGFTNTFEEFDFRIDGNWLFTMHAPNGTDFYNKNIFREIIVPERVVYEHVEGAHTYQGTFEFTEIEKSLTHVEFSMKFESADECDKVRSFVVKANEENFDRLEAVLAKMPKTNLRHL